MNCCQCKEIIKSDNRTVVSVNNNYFCNLKCFDEFAYEYFNPQFLYEDKKVNS